MNTKEKISVMQAWEDGKIIQTYELYSNNAGDWIDLMHEPVWDWRDFKYRIKPEPKEIWVNEYDSGYRSAYLNERLAINANKHGDEGADRIAVKYREVIDD